MLRAFTVLALAAAALLVPAAGTAEAHGRAVILPSGRVVFRDFGPRVVVAPLAVNAGVGYGFDPRVAFDPRFSFNAGVGYGGCVNGAAGANFLGAVYGPRFVGFDAFGRAVFR